MKLRRWNRARGFGRECDRHLLEVVSALKGRRERAILIGDSPVDVAAARAANIPVIAMSYGYTPVPAHELGADAVVDDFAKLPEAVSRLMCA